MAIVYLDNNATTRTDPEVVAAMLPFFGEHYGNPSSSHIVGEPASAAIRVARKAVQAFLGAAAEQEILFTSGGTEANNAALHWGLSQGGERNELIISAVEHPAILSVAEALEKEGCAKVHIIGVDRCGRLDIDAYKRALGPATALVSFMWANNETGTIFPIAELADLAHQAGALFHTDAVQAAGKIAIDLKTVPVDMLSLSGHKFHGPKGIGVLYLRKGLKFRPLVRGGHQERGRRGGTENVPAIVGLGRAAELAGERLGEEQAKLSALRDHFEKEVLAAIPDCVVNGDGENRLFNTSNIAFDCAEGEVILIELNKAGIACSSGSACTSGSTEPSHVLKAMGVSFTAAPGAIRFSFSRENTEDDVARLVALLPAIVEKARGASMFAKRMPSPVAGLG
jgi:cysteine desulfurase